MQKEAITKQANESESAVTKSAVREPTLLEPNVDVYESANDYLIVADVPGAAEKAVQLTLDKSELTLEAPAKWGDTPITYQRSFAVPALVDGDGLSATLNAGVLNIRLPKRPDAKPRKIAVATA